MEQKRTGLSYVFTLARGERGKLGVGMLLAVLCSALSLIPYLVVYQILLLIIQNEVTFGAMAMWACIGIAAAIGQAILMSFAGICSHVAGTYIQIQPGLFSGTLSRTDQDNAF